jgi:hypothetical protein
MLLFRWAVMLLLLAAGVSFAFYAGTGQPKYKKFGIVILKWTLFSALGFGLVLFVERVFA